MQAEMARAAELSSRRIRREPAETCDDGLAAATDVILQLPLKTGFSSGSGRWRRLDRAPLRHDGMRRADQAEIEAERFQCRPVQVGQMILHRHAILRDH